MYTCATLYYYDYKDMLCIYHTIFAYHSDICRSVYMFHTIFLIPSQRTGTHLVD
jgi:hypothetical protein